MESVLESVLKVLLTIYELYLEIEYVSVNSNTYFGYSGCLAVIDNDVRSAFGHAGFVFCC